MGCVGKNQSLLPLLLGLREGSGVTKSGLREPPTELAFFRLLFLLLRARIISTAGPKPKRPTRAIFSSGMFVRSRCRSYILPYGAPDCFRVYPFEKEVIDQAVQPVRSTHPSQKPTRLTGFTANACSNTFHTSDGWPSDEPSSLPRKVAQAVLN